MQVGERPYQFRERLRQVHRPDRRDDSIMAGVDEMQFDSGWTIVLPSDGAPSVMRVALDLQDYFFVSMGLSLPLARSQGVAGERELLLTVAPAAADGSFSGGFQIDVAASNITVTGHELCGLWNGIVHLEDLMNLREAPVLLLGKIERQPLMALRRVHSGMGIDDYPDWHLQGIIHAGFNTIEVFVKDFEVTTRGHTDINDIINRAREYGLKTFLYSYLPSYKHPDEPGAQEFFDGIYGELFRRYPDAAGVTLVGESLEFPSRDPNTTGKRWRDSLDHGIADTRPSPGWWPCVDYPAYVECIRKAVRKVKPEAEIIFNTYNWGYTPLEMRQEFLAKLPKDIIVQTTFEIFRSKWINGLSCPTMDYTISDVEPGYYFKSEAAAAHELGLRLSATTNTAGASWDFGTVPYVPVPYRWLKRLEVIEQARRDWGLERLYETHHFGWWPSVVIDLRKWSYWQPRPENLKEMMPQLARRDYGAEAADDILEVWRLWGEAMDFYVASNEDQYGPWRVGPAYPLIFQPNITRTMSSKEINFPSAPQAHFGGRIVKTLYQPYENAQQSPGPLRYRQDLKRLAEMRRLWEEGLAILEKAQAKMPPKKADYGQELLLLGKFIRHSIITTTHVKQWWLLNTKLQAADNKPEMLAILEELEKLAAAEIANAQEAMPVVELDSRLGWEPSMEYVCDKWHLEWKVKQVKSALREICTYKGMVRLEKEEG